MTAKPLRYTPLRHRMLADTAHRIAIGEGKANVYYPHHGGKGPRYTRRSGHGLTVAERRALAALDKGGAILRMNDDAPSQMGRPLSPTDAGHDLLSEWTSQHGDPLNPPTPEES